MQLTPHVDQTIRRAAACVIAVAMQQLDAMHECVGRDMITALLKSVAAAADSDALLARTALLLALLSQQRELKRTILDVGREMRNHAHDDDGHVTAVKDSAAIDDAAAEDDTYAADDSGDALDSDDRLDAPDGSG